MADTSTPAAPAAAAPARTRGLAGVIALDTAICYIDGEAGELLYRGYEIDDLARNASFEEVAYLLWHGDLPTEAQLAELHTQLRSERALRPEIIDHLRHHTPDDANPMAAVRTAVSMMAAYDPEADTMTPEANYRIAVRMTAKLPTLLAAFDRIRKGLDPVAPKGEGSTAYEFLYMLNGEAPGPSAERIFDAALVLQAEHDLNASTFAARVIGSTLADMYSAITGALGALKGPLHGGANIEVMRMLLEIDASGEDTAAYVARKFAAKEKLMGLGHRVYKTLDPRAAILRDLLEDQFALQLSLHGSLVDVYGIGLLITGPAGIGKSEIALDLVERGHRLVADDVVIATRKGTDVLMGTGTDLAKHFMEVRGLGILDVKAMFGVRAIRYQKRIEVVVRVHPWDPAEEYTRLGMVDENQTILDVPLPLVKLPVTPGKNVTVLCEVIAMNHLLRHYGYDPADEFAKRLNERIARKRAGGPVQERGVEWFEADIE